jgi:hypothetical protein
MLAGTLAGIEMSLKQAGFHVAASGVAAALAYLAGPEPAAAERASAA